MFAQSLFVTCGQDAALTSIPNVRSGLFASASGRGAAHGYAWQANRERVERQPFARLLREEPERHVTGLTTLQKGVRVLPHVPTPRDASCWPLRHSYFEHSSRCGARTDLPVQTRSSDVRSG